MPFATAADGTRLHYESAGGGEPGVVFVHEYAGDWRSFEPQMRALSDLRRCVTFSARGYPPSEIPTDPSRYSQAIARQDVISVMDAAGLGRAHVVGHSMGAYTAIHVGLAHPERCASVTAIGCGWGSDTVARPTLLKAAEAVAEAFETEGIAVAAARYADLPMRHAHKARDPRGWREFAERLAEHSAEGMALTMRNIQLRRPTLQDLAEDLANFRPPLLVLLGDEDAACLQGSLFLKSVCPTAALQVVPRRGHTLPLEDPAAVTASLRALFEAAEKGRWSLGLTDTDALP